MAMKELREAAQKASAAATPKLLEILGSEAMRSKLRQCCSKSGIADWPAQRLLAHLRENVYAAELVHNFDGSGHSGVTLEVALHNATEYFPSSWQLLNLGYLGDRLNPKYGHPAAPADAAEEGIFRLPPFRGEHDLPASYGEASSRLQYVALNMLRVDVGNPVFGNVAAVFSPSLWRDAVAAAAVDSGMYTFCCNKTYMQTPGSLRVPCERMAAALHCSAAEATPGVAGAMDHALLANHLMWGPDGVLARTFERWHSDREVNVSMRETTTFLESNILGNALYAERSIKLLVGSFAPLFGTPRGRLLQEYAAQKGIALAWALGPALANLSHHDPGAADVSFRPQARLLDVASRSVSAVNVSVASGAGEAFEKAWGEAAVARNSSGHISRQQVVELWESAKRALPAELHVQLPAAGDCSDWHSCLGLSSAGACVCYKSGQEVVLV